MKHNCLDPPSTGEGSEAGGWVVEGLDLGEGFPHYKGLDEYG